MNAVQRIMCTLTNVMMLSGIGCRDGPKPVMEPEPGVPPEPSGELNRAAVGYLSRIMDQFHTAFDVYSDADAAGNHFVARGRLSSQGGEEAVLVMDEGSTENPHSGITCIRAAFQARGANWGGWYFMNGVLEGSDAAPRENRGDFPRAGVDLRGAGRLTFWARGDRGGERVDFFAFGIGRSSPPMRHPDSSPTIQESVTLSTRWQLYSLDLGGKDLGYVLGGFGWVADAPSNNNRSIVFFIDDIRYDRARLSEPRYLVSYGTIRSPHPFDVVLRNVAFTYDNATVLLAFLAAGDTMRARLIAQALVEAQKRDRFYADGRIRNAYQGGDLASRPAGGRSARRARSGCRAGTTHRGDSGGRTSSR